MCGRLHALVVAVHVTVCVRICLACAVVAAVQGLRVIVNTNRTQTFEPSAFTNLVGS